MQTISKVPFRAVAMNITGKFIFHSNSNSGSVTNYGTTMEDVHCSPIQHMVVKRADYGVFNKNGVFNDKKSIDTNCSVLATCRVKSLCGGNRSCELTIDNNLLPSPYCSNHDSDTSKQIYTEYTCVDTYKSTTITTGMVNNLFWNVYINNN